MLTSVLSASFAAAVPQPPGYAAASPVAQASSAGPETISSRPIRVIMAPPPAINNNCEAAPRAQVRDLTCSEAAGLIERLKQAQTKLAAGGQLYFELLSGALASSQMTKVSPRDVFMEMPFEKAMIIERVRTENRLWQPYKLSYSSGSHDYGPSGLVQFYWDIEVVLGFTGGIERVHMTFKPPPPH